MCTETVRNTDAFVSVTAKTAREIYIMACRQLEPKFKPLPFSTAPVTPAKTVACPLFLRTTATQACEMQLCNTGLSLSQDVWKLQVLSTFR